MTIDDIYQYTIKEGIAHDPRGKKGVEKDLLRRKKYYQQMPKEEKKYFNKENLSHPYSDTRILYGDPTTIVDKVLVGIDIGVGELVLADRLNEKGEGIDLVIAHHPHGSALAALSKVMDLQIDIFSSYGVPLTVAEHITRKKIDEISRRFAPLNHFQAVDAARLLNLPFMCIHTPADNIGWNYLRKKMEGRDFDTVEEVVEYLLSIEEFIIGKKQEAGPVLFNGSLHNRAGKVRIAEFTGGTEGAKEIYERLSQAGVGTIIAMHISEEHLKEAKKHHINIVVTGHMAADSLGMNLLLDYLAKQNITIIPCSGFIRVQRI